MKKLKIRLLALAICALPFTGGAQQHWQQVGGGFDWASGVQDLYVDTTTDLLYIAGRVSWVDTICSPGLFAWNGTNFIGFGCGIDWDCQGLYQSAGPSVTSVTKYNNEIYVAGAFSNAGGKVCNNIARWNGTDWDSVGVGTSHAINKLRVINGELYAMGAFVTAGGLPANGIAKWDGTNWSTVNNFPNYSGNILSDVLEYNGELYVCGNFTGTNGCKEIVKWDGTSWGDVGGGLFGGNSFAEDLCIYQNKLYVGGYFIKSQDINNPGNFIAAWDGTSWSDPGGGTFNPYSPFSNGQIHDMHVYHNELYIASTLRFAGGVPGSCVAKWDGTQWCTFDTINSFDARPYALDDYHDTLFVGGGFWTISGDSMVSLAKWVGGNYVDTCGYFYLGVDDPSTATQTISVYPNPAATNITFQLSGFDGDKTLLIYDQLGKEIWRKETGENQIDISVADFAEGMYFYQVILKDNIKSSGKFIIEH